MRTSSSWSSVVVVVVLALVVVVVVVLGVVVVVVVLAVVVVVVVLVVVVVVVVLAVIVVVVVLAVVVVVVVLAVVVVVVVLAVIVVVVVLVVVVVVVVVVLAVVVVVVVLAVVVVVVVLAVVVVVVVLAVVVVVVVLAVVVVVVVLAVVVVVVVLAVVVVVVVLAVIVVVVVLVVIVVVVVLVVVVVVVVLVVIVVVVVLVVIVVVVVVVVVVVAVFAVEADHAVAGPVRVALDAAPELQADGPEVHFLVGERSHGGQVGAGRQRLEAGGLEVAHLRPGAEASGEPLGLLLVELRPHDVGAVVEARADVLEPVLHLELVVAPVDDVHRHPQPFDEAVAQVPHAEVEAAHLAPRGEVDLEALLLALVRVVVLVPVAGVVRVVRVVDVVRAVELVGERHAVAALLEGEAAAGEEGAVVVARAGARVRELGRGVGDGALRGVVVAGAPRAAAGPQAESALGVLQVDVDPGLRRWRSPRRWRSGRACPRTSTRAWPPAAR